MSMLCYVSPRDSLILLLSWPPLRDDWIVQGRLRALADIVSNITFTAEARYGGARYAAAP